MQLLDVAFEEIRRRNVLTWHIVKLCKSLGWDVKKARDLNRLTKGPGKFIDDRSINRISHI